MKNLTKSVVYRIFLGIIVIIIGIIMSIYSSVRQSLRRGETPDIPDPNDFDVSFLPYVVSIVAPVLIGSALIDYVRKDTDWPNITKSMIGIFLFILTFFFILLGIFLAELS